MRTGSRDLWHQKTSPLGYFLHCLLAVSVDTATFDRLAAVPSLLALGSWAPPAERGPSLESIYRVSLTVDLCEG